MKLQATGLSERIRVLSIFQSAFIIGITLVSLCLSMVKDMWHYFWLIPPGLGLTLLLYLLRNRRYAEMCVYLNMVIICPDDRRD